LIFCAFDFTEKIPRTYIWLAGIKVFCDNSFQGILNVRDSLTYEIGQAHPSLAKFQIDHAHNAWLQMAIRFGAIGFILSFLLSFAVGYYAWFFGKSKGLAFVFPFFVMNFFDYSFNFIGVWFPLVLGLIFLLYKEKTL